MIKDIYCDKHKIWHNNTCKLCEAGIPATGGEPPTPEGDPVALKYDDGKPRLDLIEPDFENGLGFVLTHGIDKYEEDSWQGIEPKRYIAAAKRHINAHLKAIRNGASRPIDFFDNDSGLLHLEHAAACMMFLHWQALKNPEVKHLRNRHLVEKTYLKGGGRDKIIGIRIE